MKYRHCEITKQTVSVNECQDCPEDCKNADGKKMDKNLKHPTFGIDRKFKE